MLLTTCPQCDARFRVETEQLNVRQGRVMCGRCRHVFNAFESLERHDTDFGDIPEVRAGAFHTSVTAVDPADGQPPLMVERVDKKTAVETGTARNDEPLPLDTENVPVEDDAPSTMAEVMVTAIVPPPVPPLGDNPLLMPSRDRVRRDRSRWWTPAACCAALLLALQLAYLFRSDILQAYPPSRPALARACEALRCTLQWGRDEAAMKIESSDLIEVPGRNGRLLLSAIIANRAKTAQDLPLLEIKLTDTANNLLASRLLTPQDYLGRPPGSDENVPVDAELFVHLQIDWKGKAVPSGYSIRVLYPA